MGNASLLLSAASSVVIGAPTLDAARSELQAVQGRRLISVYTEDNNFEVPQLVHERSLEGDLDRLLDADMDDDFAREEPPIAAQHLFVLAHGLASWSSDLEFIANIIRSTGGHVLCSSRNETVESFKGCEECAALLVEEIVSYHQANPELRFISMVGNSLGGILCRIAARTLMAQGWLGMTPWTFMSIATPHIGVRHHTYLETEVLGAKLPSALREPIVDFMATALQKTGKELLLKDAEEARDSLMYRITTSEDYVRALSSFRRRRLYANLLNDLVVPLHTAAFLEDELAQRFRQRHSGESGIVAVVKTKKRSWTAAADSSPDDAIANMRLALDSTGWTKVLVHHPSTLPTAHSKLAAVSRFPEFLHSDMLGFKKGNEIMAAAARWMCGIPPELVERTQDQDDTRV